MFYTLTQLIFDILDCTYVAFAKCKEKGIFGFGLLHRYDGGKPADF